MQQKAGMGFQIVPGSAVFGIEVLASSVAFFDPSPDPVPPTKARRQTRSIFCVFPHGDLCSVLLIVLQVITTPPPPFGE